MPILHHHFISQTRNEGKKKKKEKGTELQRTEARLNEKKKIERGNVNDVENQAPRKSILKPSKLSAFSVLITMEVHA